MALLGLVILREGFELTEVVFRSLLRKESQGTVTRTLELTMRHLFASRLNRNGLVLIDVIFPCERLEFGFGFEIGNLELHVVKLPMRKCSNVTALSQTRFTKTHSTQN